VPPVEFEKLVDSVAPDEIKLCIAELLSLKRTMPELGLGEPIEAINDFIEHESERHGQSYQGQGRPDLLDRQDLRDQLNALFRIAISEAFR